LISGFLERIGETKKVNGMSLAEKREFVKSAYFLALVWRVGKPVC